MDNPEENVRKLYRKFDCVRKIFPVQMQFLFISRSDLPLPVLKIYINYPTNEKLEEFVAATMDGFFYEKSLHDYQQDKMESSFTKEEWQE
jgi:hypothetical protein